HQGAPVTTVAIIVETIAMLFVIVGAFGFLVSGIAMLRVRDSVSRVNSLGPATAVGLPFILIGALIHVTLDTGWSWANLVMVMLSILASDIVSSVASNTLGRVAYRSGAPLDHKTDPNELAGH